MRNRSTHSPEKLYDILKNPVTIDYNRDASLSTEIALGSFHGRESGSTPVVHRGSLNDGENLERPLQDRFL
jgi:hypothetical protein